MNCELWSPKYRNRTPALLKGQSKRRSAILVLLVSIVGVRVARRAFVLVAGAQSGKAEIRTTDAGNRTYSERRVASHPGLFGSERAHQS